MNPGTECPMPDLWGCLVVLVVCACIVFVSPAIRGWRKGRGGTG